MQHTSAFFWVAILLGYQVALVFAPHPEQIERPWLRALVRLLGRLSLLRHRSAPGTFHPPGTRQPWWSPEQLEQLLGELAEVRGQMRRLPEVPPISELRRHRPQVIAWLQPPAAALVLLAMVGCASLRAPREATARAYTDHVTRISELNNFEADEGIKLLDAAPVTTEGKARYEAAIAAHRKACDFAKALLAKSLKSIEDIRGTLAPKQVKP